MFLRNAKLEQKLKPDGSWASTIQHHQPTRKSVEECYNQSIKIHILLALNLSLGRCISALCKGGRSDSFTTNPQSSDFQHNLLQSTYQAQAPHIISHAGTTKECPTLEGGDPQHSKQSPGTPTSGFAAIDAVCSAPTWDKAVKIQK